MIVMMVPLPLAEQLMVLIFNRVILKTQQGESEEEKGEPRTSTSEAGHDERWQHQCLAHFEANVPTIQLIENANENGMPHVVSTHHFFRVSFPVRGSAPWREFNFNFYQ